MSQAAADPPKKLTPLQNALSGAVAGVVSRIVIAPLDVVKIRFQLQVAPNILSLSKTKRPESKYTGIVQTFRRIVREEGLQGLWKGNLSAELLYLTYGATQFYTYYAAQAWVTEWDTDNSVPISTRTFLCGSLAGTSATLITYPLDLLRTRFAAQGEQRIYNSYADAVAKIYRNEGFLGFYRGVFPTVVQIIPSMGIIFESQRFFKAMFERMRSSRSDLPLNQAIHGVEDFVSGGLSGILTKTLMLPFDVVRKRLQVQGPDRNSYITPNVPRYPRSFIAVMRQIVKHEGFFALYKGLFPALLKTGPSAAVTFLVVGQCRHWLAKIS
ncbi:solute carrier protein [Polychytrium aggregatum]|uniref:solute carrier protein n=1 Tax=Polychytrium aggregatum TaxID=110093 RepID=UPI0022FE8BCB|nr:solute carrier protein [Polychytrium aggregatum]KAI9202631.1 solute carrier protein [Polychytrium aggregatum]